MNENFEQKYGYLWETPGHYWVLLKDPELQGEFAVFNKRGSVLLIESEEEHAEVCNRMIASGCEVLDSIPGEAGRVARPESSKGVASGE